MRAADPLVCGRVVRANVSLATSCGSHGIMARVPGVEVSSSAPRLFVPPCSFLLGRRFHFSVKKAKIQEHLAPQGSSPKKHCPSSTSVRR